MTLFGILASCKLSFSKSEIQDGTFKYCRHSTLVTVTSVLSIYYGDSNLLLLSEGVGIPRAFRAACSGTYSILSRRLK
jgi:hypothetical protein